MSKKSMISIKKATGNKPQKKQLLLLILILIVVVILTYGLWLFFSLQGKFIVYRETIPPNPLTHTVDSRFIIKVLEGFSVHAYDFARYYGNEYEKNRNAGVFSPNYELTVKTVSEDVDARETFLAIRGKTVDEFPTMALVKYSQGKFQNIPYYNGSRFRELYFASPQVLLKNLDNDPELEVILGILLTSDDGSSQIWDKTRLDYNAEKNAYFQTSVTHDPNLE